LGWVKRSHILWAIRVRKISLKIAKILRLRTEKSGSMSDVWICDL